MDERHNPEFIAKIAGRILSDHFGEEICLCPEKIFSTWGSIVVRCRVIGQPSAIPHTLIVKKAREDRVKYDPDSSSVPNAAHAIFNDWAAIRFLNQISSDPPLSPSSYGGSREFGLIVLEDLGDGDAPNTADALHGREPALAEALLVDHASLIGRLHAATIGRAAEYRRIRGELGPWPQPKKLYQDPWSDARREPIEESEIEEAIRIYRNGFETIGINPRSGVEDEIALVTAEVERDPGPFLAFCKGDQDGAGDYIRCGAQPRLFDFGVGGYRHALIEGMPGRMTWGSAMCIPRRILPLMQRGYQLQLGQGCWEAIDQALFHRELVKAGARWNIFHLVHRLPEALERDRQRGPTTLRQQIMAWIEAFADLSEEYGQLPALGHSAREMRARLCELWPAETHSLPFYPAFQ